MDVDGVAFLVETCDFSMFLHNFSPCYLCSAYIKWFKSATSLIFASWPRGQEFETKLPNHEPSMVGAYGSRHPIHRSSPVIVTFDFPKRSLILSHT